MPTCYRSRLSCFNTQPPKGGWMIGGLWRLRGRVSTHSRLKAAGLVRNLAAVVFDVSTHSRLKAAGFLGFRCCALYLVSTHSRLKAAGWAAFFTMFLKSGFNTQPPKGGWVRYKMAEIFEFVSTHSRLKAAGSDKGGVVIVHSRFNTQPPKGGW